jgi:hypothetical protein
MIADGQLIKFLFIEETIEVKIVTQLYLELDKQSISMDNIKKYVETVFFSFQNLHHNRRRLHLLPFSKVHTQHHRIGL